MKRLCFYCHSEFDIHLPHFDPIPIAGYGAPRIHIEYAPPSEELCSQCCKDETALKKLYEATHANNH